MTRVLVTGDRHWTAEAPIAALIRRLPAGSVVIHGAAAGADTMAGMMAIAAGIDVDRPPTAGWPYGGYAAGWTFYGRAAGPIRNKQMLDEGKPDVVIAFHDDMSRSKGTRDMVRQAHRAGIEWRVYDSAGRLTPRKEILSIIG